MKQLLAAAFSSVDQARAFAQVRQATLFADERPDTSHLPFAALVTGVGDSLAPWLDADIGTFLIAERIIKDLPTRAPGEQPGRIGLFTMVANPDLGRDLADAHWRDNHAPLALDVHEAMTNYRQLSVLHTLKGPDWHGFALCGFASEADLRERFYKSKAGEQAIARDIATFADTRRSPRRLIVSETRY